MILSAIVADTPWTFPLWLTWALLSVVAPLLLVIAMVLAALRSTRSIGLRMLSLGFLGALVGCAADVALAMLAGESLSQSTAVGWLFAAAGGFPLFAVPAGVIARASLHAKT
jgi:hypothetical protein